MASNDFFDDNNFGGKFCSVRCHQGTVRCRVRSLCALCADLSQDKKTKTQKHKNTKTQKDKKTKVLA